MALLTYTVEVEGYRHGRDGVLRMLVRLGTERRIWAFGPGEDGVP